MCQDTHESALSDGINKIVALDDNFLWSASGSSMIRRWRVPQRRAVRALSIPLDAEIDRPSQESPPSAASSIRRGHGENSSLSWSDSEHHPVHRDKGDKGTLYSIPFESLVKLTSPNNPFGFYTTSKERDPDIATLYSAASVMSVPKTNLRSQFSRHSHHHIFINKNTAQIL